ncbi:hypothetical protein EYF80_031523 [Liparis tanakae]|uniref:Uncharacterized protein n=1 Tax=Liparis tanakae TaxID=230148 RepID=A0A4Z2GZT2_9TELE|nr:hypothetical protein EYF80_031523 [Liparis tanakae]
MEDFILYHLEMEALHETLRTRQGSSYTSLHLQLCCNTHGFTGTSPCVKMSHLKVLLWTSSL